MNFNIGLPKCHPKLGFLKILVQHSNWSGVLESFPLLQPPNNYETYLYRDLFLSQWQD